MIFNSYIFLIFLVAVVSLYYSLPHSYRWILLLGASYYFYMCWKPEYVIILAVATLIDFYFAWAIHGTDSQKKKKRYLLASLFLSIGSLFLFKYFNFFNASLKVFLDSFNILYNVPTFRWLLPVGLSYYTFKKISYMIDVYRGNLEPSRHLGKFALYISFFPEITAGPIDRAGHLLPQFDQYHKFEYQPIVDGLKLFVWGMFKKVVVADRLAILVDRVFSNTADYQGISFAIAALYFSIQIYADFSGYTDMAIGVAQMMGFQLADNFNRPYSAISITDFWKRWHISFTSWLRDYLFLPLAYPLSRKIKSATLIGIKAETWAYVWGTFITMLLCGLWHGAGWTFVLWGGGHGLYLVLSFITRKFRKKWRKKLIPTPLKKMYHYVRMVFTFSAVSFLWIFFRANSVTEAFYIIASIFNPHHWHFIAGKKWIKTSLLLGQSGPDFIITVLGIGFILFFHALQPHDSIRKMLSQKPLLLRWFLYILLVLVILNLGVVNQMPFIYAEF